MGSQKWPDNKHSITINTTDLRRVFAEIVLWSEASWWPKHCMMKFTHLSSGPIGVATVYRQKVTLPFAPQWYAVVQEIVDNKSIKRKFVQSFLQGNETISVTQVNAESVQVGYQMGYAIDGTLDNLLWKAFLQTMHDANIESILKSLKRFIETKKP